MINLNTYILEKLKINKNTKLSGYHPGSIILCVALYNRRRPGSTPYLEIRTYPFELIEIKYDDEIHYYGYDNKNKISKSVVKNSNEFYEYDGSENIGLCRKAVYLDTENGIEFMNYLKNEYETNFGKLYKYFDDGDDFLDDYEINIVDKEKIDEVIDKLKGKIPITEKLHIDKDTKLFDKISGIIQDMFDKKDFDFGPGIDMDIKYETSSRRDIIRIIPSKEVELNRMHDISNWIQYELEIEKNIRIMGVMVNKEEIKYFI